MPPNKRLRGDPSYGPPPGIGELPFCSCQVAVIFHILLLVGHYTAPSYGTTRPNDYQAARRPIPAASQQAAYYRPEDRARY
jgi:hypothetical protein